MLIRLFLFFLILAPRAAGHCLKDTTENRPSQGIEKFDPGRDAAKDIQNAIVAAEKSGKRILLDVGGEWCVWCRKLDSLFHADQKISGVLHRNYIVVKVNFSKENENEKVLSAYPKIEGYPHLFVLDSNGKLLHSQDTGLLESGKHHDPGKVMAFLKRWAPGKKTVNTD